LVKQEIYLTFLGTNHNIIKLLVNEGADINSKDNNGITPLMAASMKGNLKAVNFLLSNGAKIDSYDYSKETALFKAAKEGYPKIVEKLIQAGAKTNMKNSKGNTPLRIAELNKNKEVIEILKKQNNSK